MLRKLSFIFVSLLSSFAFADYGTILCDGGLQKVELRISEMSDITYDVSTLMRANKTQKIHTLSAEQSDYGVLRITIHVGEGKNQTKYIFDNLGSDQCFGVYDSKQTGAATVRVSNEKGDLVDTTCVCSVD